MIKAVVFDMDGLMFDTERTYMWMWAQQLKNYGLDFTPELARSIRGSNDAGIRSVLEKTYGPGFDYVSVRDKVRSGVQKFLDTEGVPVKPGLRELLDFLVQRQIPRAVASSSRRVSVEHNCRAAGVLESFDALVCGDMVSRSKPDPEIFQVASRMLGVLPKECLVLEDSFNGVRAGHAGGFVTVMVPDLDEPIPEIDALYTRKAESLLEVLTWLKNGRL